MVRRVQDDRRSCMLGRDGSGILSCTYASGPTCTWSKMRSLLAVPRMASIRQVSSMCTPDMSRVTRKSPRGPSPKGLPYSSSTLQPTRKKWSAWLPVVKVLRPLMIHEPSGWQRAVVVGRPPRLGLPVAGSETVLFSMAPCSITARQMSLKRSLNSVLPSARRAIWVRCMPATSAVEPSPCARRY